VGKEKIQKRYGKNIKKGNRPINNWQKNIIVPSEPSKEKSTSINHSVLRIPKGDQKKLLY